MLRRTRCSFSTGDVRVRRYRTDPASGERIPLPSLRMPGGPRLSAHDIKMLYRVATPGHLAKYDWRFLMNIGLTHAIMKHLNRTKAVDKLYVELGPGPGMLTRSLLTLPSLGVFGIELDTKFNPHLDEIRTHSQGKFLWANADVTNVDEAALLEKHCPEVTEWLAKAAQASTFLELRQKIRAMRERRNLQNDQGRKYAAAAAASKANNTKNQEYGVSDEELDELLAEEESGLRGGGGAGSSSPSTNNGGSQEETEEEQRKSRTLRSPFSADEAGTPGTVGPITGGACEATSTLWQGSPKIEVVGNLPFAIAAEMTLRYCVDCSRRHNLFKYGRIPFHIFFQKEVAERLIAAPGSTNFGRLSVVAQNYFSVQVKSTFLEKTYYPSTEVLGALITLEPRVAPIVEVDGAVLSNFVDIVLAPGARTKSLFSSMKRCMPAEVAVHILSELRIDGSMLPTTVSAPEFAKMALMWIRYLEATNQGEVEDVPFRQSGAAVADKPKQSRRQRDEAVKAKQEQRKREVEAEKRTRYW